MEQAEENRTAALPGKGIRLLAVCLLLGAAVTVFALIPGSIRELDAEARNATKKYTQRAESADELRRFANELREEKGMEPIADQPMTEEAPKAEEPAEELPQESLSPTNAQTPAYTVPTPTPTVSVPPTAPSTGSGNTDELARAEAKINAGEKMYAEAEGEIAALRVMYAQKSAELADMETVYNILMPFYTDYQTLQARYDAALADPNTSNAERELLRLRLEVLKTAFETQLGLSGISLSAFLNGITNQRSELDAVGEQIAAAEAKREEALSMIQTGKQERELAHQQPQMPSGGSTAGTTPSGSGSSAVTTVPGGSSLGTVGAAQTEQTKTEVPAETMPENSYAPSNTEEIQPKDVRQEKIDCGRELFAEDVGDERSAEMADAVFFASAQKLYREKLEQLESGHKTARLVCLALLLTAAIAAGTLVWTMTGLHLYARWAALCCSVLSAACALAWMPQRELFGTTPLLAGAVLFAAALFTAVVGFAYHLPNLVNDGEDE